VLHIALSPDAWQEHELPNILALQLIVGSRVVVLKNVFLKLFGFIKKHSNNIIIDTKNTRQKKLFIDISVFSFNLDLLFSR